MNIFNEGQFLVTQLLIYADGRVSTGVDSIIKAITCFNEIVSFKAPLKRDTLAIKTPPLDAGTQLN